jgi:translation elongation factor EF-4
MTFLLNGKPVDALALVVHRSVVQEVGKAWVTKLRKQPVVPPLSFSSELFAFPDKVIPRQMFDVPIQASIGSKVVARMTLSALRADVTAGLYGGHYERKLKHLVNQKESKKKMKRVGSVDLPQEAFFDILRSKPS